MLRGIGSFVQKHVVPVATQVQRESSLYSISARNITHAVDSTSEVAQQVLGAFRLPTQSTRIVTPHGGPLGLDSRNIASGLSVNAEGGNIVVRPNIFSKMHPTYVPKEAKRSVTTQSAFNVRRDVSGLSLPSLFRHPMVGKQAKIVIDGENQNATVVGFDYKERPIVKVDGDAPGRTRIIKQAEQAQAFIPEREEYRSCAETLTRGLVYEPSAEFNQLMEHALTRPIVGQKSAMHYIDWLHQNGSECYVLGGAIRDISRELLSRSLAPEEAAEIVNDIDVSVVGGAPTGRRMFREVHGDDPDLHVDGFDEYGCVHGKIGSSGAGFDFNAMMIGNHTYDPHKVHPDISEEGALPPAQFGGLPERCVEALDFCCNSLFYDPVNRLIIDPTGHGLEDAAHNFLRLTDGEKLLHNPEETLPYKQVELLQRFWKFRFRGSNSNPYTTLLFQTMANDRWTSVNPIKFYSDILKMLPIGKIGHLSDQDKIVELNNMLDRLKDTMAQDDQVTGQNLMLFERFIEPRRSEVINFCMNYKKPKQ